MGDREADHGDRLAGPSDDQPGAAVHERRLCKIGERSAPFQPAIAIVPWFLAGSLFPITALPTFLTWFGFTRSAVG